MTNENEKKMLSALYSTYCKLDRKNQENLKLKRNAETRAENSPEGKKYFLAEQKCKERSKKNIKLQNTVITALIAVVSLIVLGVTLYFSAVTVFKNLDTILLPSAGTPSEDVWTNKQYGVLYTLGILMFVSAVVGIILCVLKKENTTLLGCIYLVLGVLSYVGLIVYSFVNGTGSNKITGIFLIIVVPLFMIVAIFSSGIRAQFVAMMPSILMILLALVAIGVVYVVITKAIKANIKRMKVGDKKLVELQKERNKAYDEYYRIRQKYEAECKYCSTYEEDRQIQGYVSALRLSQQNANMQKVGQLLWCIENSYANNIVEANNWLYNDANRKRAEAETARHRANILKKADELEKNISKKLDEQNESIKNVGKKVDELNKSVQNQKIVNKIDIEIK